MAFAGPLLRTAGALPSNHQVVYVAPLKALVRERVLDWSQRVCPKIGKRLVELTGDLTPDLQSLQRCASRPSAMLLGRQLTMRACVRTSHVGDAAGPTSL